MHNQNPCFRLIGMDTSKFIHNKYSTHYLTDKQKITTERYESEESKLTITWTGYPTINVKKYVILDETLV